MHCMGDYKNNDLGNPLILSAKNFVEPKPPTKSAALEGSRGAQNTEEDERSIASFTHYPSHLLRRFVTPASSNAFEDA